MEWSQIKTEPATKAQKKHLHGMQILQHSIIERLTKQQALEAIEFCRQFAKYNETEKKVKIRLLEKTKEQ